MHTFTFFRLGGFDQVRLSSAADLAAIDQLDRKLWAALACPVRGLELDERTLAMVDTDADGRVRAPEVLAAVRWCQERLTDLGAIIPGRDQLPLALIRQDRPGGVAMLGCAKRVLDKAGTPAATAIGLEAILPAAGALAQTRFNGDGVIPPGSAGDDTLAAAITDIASTRAPVLDRSGAAGLDRAGYDAFRAEAVTWLAWWDAGQADASRLLPLGDGTPAALAAIEAVRAKVDDFFMRCRAAAFDARAAAILSVGESDWRALSAADLSVGQDAIVALPLALVQPGATVPRGLAVNPAWSQRLEALHTVVITPLLGFAETLTEAAWREACARLEPFRAWRCSEPNGSGRLGATRLRELLQPAVADGLEALFRQDQEVKPEFDALADLERLVRYHRDLYRLLSNFVNFADVYHPERYAIFQAGTLFLDSRASELCVLVNDMAKHGALATRAHAYLLYCDCTRAGGAKQTICAVMANGDAEGLLVGRNGLFMDRQGRDWDATVVKVVEHPISIREAFWSPYRRTVRFVEEFIAKRAAEADKASESKLSDLATTTVAAAAQPGSPAAKPKIDVGTVAALGVAVGGITTALGLLLNAIFGLKWWIPVGLIGLVLLISGPSMVLAWLKLRSRTLGPILDANGWAVNGRVRINIPFGAALTTLAELPPGSHRMLGDPYAERRRPWGRILILTVILAATAWTAYDRWDTGAYWWQQLAPPPPAEAAGD